MCTRKRTTASGTPATPSASTLRLHPSMLVLALALALGGCASIDNKTTDAGKTVVPPYKGGGYYKDDGPGANPPSNLAEIPDAVPKHESLHRYANDPYKVLGRKYVPIADNTDYKSRGLASWYGRKFHGKSTSIGEPYDMYAMSAAHATLPLPSYARVTNLENGKSVVVRVNDRGPFHPGRIIDLSYTAAYKLDILKGVTKVEVESVSPDSAPTSFSAQAEEDPVAVVTPIASTDPAPVSTPVATVEPAPVVSPVAMAESVPVAPPVEIAAALPANPGKAIYLQLGAYGNQTTADNLLARASANLSRDFPGVMRLESHGLHKVQAGPFASADAADRAAALIQQDMGIKTFKVLADVPALTPKTSAPPDPAATSTPTPGPGLYLQLVAVSSAEAAEALASRVKSRFGDELPGLNQVSVGNLFKLQAGPFETPTAAERVALAYQQDFGIKPYPFTR